MPHEYCYGFVCFVPLGANTPKVFGFPEFLTGLALIALAWTIADVRYRFRISTAPLPLQLITFMVVCVVGFLALLTDLWRAERWLVPRGTFITPSEWQAILGGLLLLTVLVWAWFAFIRPPIFGKANAQRYAQALYRIILRASPSELPVIADEFARSGKSVISYAIDNREAERYLLKTGDKTPGKKPPKVTRYANDILLLIADKRFCRAIVDSSPRTALAVFQEIGVTKKYGVQVKVFARNVVNSALANKDSFLFHEAEGYDTGLMGYVKPLSQAMFSDFAMVEAIGTFFDPDVSSSWNADQWRAYCRIVLMAFRDYVEQEWGGHSFVLFRAKGHIEHAAPDLYKLNGTTLPAWDNEVLSRLRVVLEFIRSAIEVLDKKGVPEYVTLRRREERMPGTMYDHLAGMIFEVIFQAATVSSPKDLCWFIQHNTVWIGLFNYHRNDGPAAAVVKFKVRRLMYDEIAQMRKFPNFKGARILGFCLNVMGFVIRADDASNDSRALQTAVLRWTKKNYAWLHSYNPRVAEACLADGFTYEAERLRLVKTYPAEGLQREPKYEYFAVDRAT